MSTPLKAPPAIGPYSPAVVAPAGCDLVFCSGQIPVDPDTGDVAWGTVSEQTVRCLQNLSAVLAAYGCTLEDVVKTTVFLTDLGDFQAMNGAYAGVFGSHKPARACVEVSRLPKEVSVEIEAVAARRNGSSSP